MSNSSDKKLQLKIVLINLGLLVILQLLSAGNIYSNDIILFETDTASNTYNIKNSNPNADGLTDDTPAFLNAFGRADAVFVAKGNYAINTVLKIPVGKKLIFDKGAVLDVSGVIIGNQTELKAGQSQIFTLSSNITGTWVYNEAYPEWFGAQGDSVTKSGAAIEKCLHTFVHRVKAYGKNYLIEESIDFPQFGDLEMGANTKFTNHFRMYDPIIRISKEKFYLRGGTIQIMWYHDMYNGKFIAGQPKDAYTGWVIDVKLKRDQTFKQDHFRQNSFIKDLSILPVRSPGDKNRQHLIYDGIRVTSNGINDASYSVEVSNLYIRMADTALYLQGHQESGMINSWHFNGYTSDASLHAIVLGNRAAGNIFTNTTIQPYKAKPWGSTVQIDIASKYNRVEGVFWDIFCDSSIVLRYKPNNNPRIEAAHNTIDMNCDRIHNYLIEEKDFYNYNNIVVPTGLKPARYYDGVVTTKGNGRMRIGGYDDTYLSRGERLQVAGNLEFYSVNENRTKLLRAVKIGEGNVPVKEKMQWVMRFVDDNGDTSSYTKPIAKNIAGQSEKIRLDFTAPLDLRIKKTLIYRQKQRGNNYYFAGKLDNINDTSFYDNKADNELGHKAIFDNKDETAGAIYKDGRQYVTFSDNETIVSKTLTVNDVLKLSPQKSPPDNPSEGALYVNSSDHHIYCFLNGIWKRLD